MRGGEDVGSPVVDMSSLLLSSSYILTPGMKFIFFPSPQFTSLLPSLSYSNSRNFGRTSRSQKQETVIGTEEKDPGSRNRRSGKERIKEIEENEEETRLLLPP